MKIVYARRALADIDQISASLGALNQDAADRTVKAIVEAIELVSHVPAIGTEKPRLGVRSRVVRIGRRSYSIFYRIDDDAISISHIRDGRRAPLKPGDI